jgi:hypothetical protein
VAGVAAAEGVEAALVPAALVAVTVNVYGVPLVNPVTVHELVSVVQVKPPGLEVAVYPVMAAPPLEVDAVHDTTDWALAYEVADTLVGALGTVAGIAEADAVEAGPVPAPLVAVTVKV